MASDSVAAGSLQLTAHEKNEPDSYWARKKLPIFSEMRYFERIERFPLSLEQKETIFLIC